MRATKAVYPEPAGAGGSAPATCIEQRLQDGQRSRELHGGTGAAQLCPDGAVGLGKREVGIRVIGWGPASLAGPDSEAWTKTGEAVSDGLPAVLGQQLQDDRLASWIVIEMEGLTSSKSDPQGAATSWAGSRGRWAALHAVPAGGVLRSRVPVGVAVVGVCVQCLSHVLAEAQHNIPARIRGLTQPRYGTFHP